MKKICTRCGSLGESVCPSCGVQDTMIDINTPIGKKLYSKYHTEQDDQEKVVVINNTEKKRSGCGCLIGCLILVFLFIASFVIIPVVIVPIHRGYTRAAMAAEAKSLLGSIQVAEKVYYAEYSNYFVTPKNGTNHSLELDVDARANKYFKIFKIEKISNGNGFKATTNGDGSANGKKMELESFKDGRFKFTDNFLD